MRGGGNWITAALGDVDVDQLQQGLDAMEATAGGGRPSDVHTVLARVYSELQKMATNAELLAQKENFLTRAFDNWAAIIRGLMDRANAISDAAGKESWPPPASQWPVDQAGKAVIPPSGNWAQVKVLAVEVGSASNQLAAELGSAPWLIYLAVGAAGYLAWSLVVSPALAHRRGAI
jgi:hypothetical protein